MRTLKYELFGTQGQGEMKVGSFKTREALIKKVHKLYGQMSLRCELNGVPLNLDRLLRRHELRNKLEVVLK